MTEPGPVQVAEAAEAAEAVVVRPADGLKLLVGNLGRSVIKVSSVPDDRHVIEVAQGPAGI